MTNITHFQHYNSSQGLKGFFSWLKKAVKAVVRVTVNIILPGNGFGTFDALVDFFDGDGSFGEEQLGNILGGQRNMFLRNF